LSAASATPSGPLRPVLTAELLAIGSELTAGETRDTNSGELAASLASAGVAVRRISALPDRLDLVADGFRDGFANADLVVSTGGLGPTPDDLTREALAEVIGETPTVDPDLEAWLRGLFARRGTPFAEVNIKQAWRVPSAASIPNDNGTAPGWWVDRADGGIAVLLPGPPREMRPMWTGWVLPRLRERGLGDGRVVRVLRTYGIGESSVVDRLGEPLFRVANPVVATYARAEWLDLRISAIDDVAPDGGVVRTAGELVAEAEARIRAELAGHVWAEGEATWAEVVGAAAAARGVRFATTEAGTSGALAVLLAEVPQLAGSIVRGGGAEPAEDELPSSRDLLEAARAAALEAGAPVGLALAARPDGSSTLVRVAVSVPWASDGAEGVLDLTLFARGAHGRLRAAIAAAAFLVELLRTGEAARR
jgi:nicotinamide-nucleotide amidase